MLRLKPTSKFYVSLLVAIVTTLAVILFLLRSSGVEAAACSAEGGKARMTVNVDTTATYTVWVRLLANSNMSNEVYLDIDGKECFLIGGNNALPNDSWTWVDYKNGSQTQKATVNLDQGQHTATLIGHKAGVKVDRLLLISGSSCIPHDQGDNCVESNPPSTKLGDIDGDGKVNIFDLSILLSRWQVQASGDSADLNNDGTVDIFDLSTLLSRWGA